MQKLRQWLIDTYNGLYVIVIQPYMPNRSTVIALAVGFLIGLVWAYSVRPVEFYDAAPYRLHESYREEWLRLTGIAKEAQVYTDDYIAQLLDQVENPSSEIQRMLALPVDQGPSGRLRSGLEQVAPIAATVEGTPAPQPGNIIGDLVWAIIGVILIIVIAVIAILLWGVFIKPNFVDALRERMRPKTEEDIRRKENLVRIKEQREAEVKAREEAAQGAAGNPYGAAITLKLPSYVKGRSFDESYAIENANDEFLGEFGATIAKTIGDTNEPCAIEIWLFDKEDFVRTLTKVFLTEHAYNDPAIRSDLENRVDDPDKDMVIVKPGAIIQLETNAILVQAAITRLELGSEGLLPPNSYFKELSLRMEAWDKKNTAGVGMGTPAMPAATPAAVPSTPAYNPPPMPPTAPPPAYNPPPTPPAYNPPPSTPPTFTPPPPPPPKRPATQDDDPFGGTGDFTPIG